MAALASGGDVLAVSLVLIVQHGEKEPVAGDPGLTCAELGRSLSL